MIGELVSDIPIHKIGELVTDIASPYTRTTIFKVTGVEIKQGWYHYKIVPLSFFERLKLRIVKQEVKLGFPSNCVDSTKKEVIK